MSLQTASEASQKIQVQVDQSLRRVNTTDHNLEQLEGLQVSEIYCLGLGFLMREAELIFTVVFRPITQT